MTAVLEVREQGGAWNLILEPEAEERANTEIYDKREGEFSAEYEQLVGYLNGELQDPELIDEYARDRIDSLGREAIAERLKQEGYLERNSGRWEASKPEGEEKFDPKEAHEVDTEEGDSLDEKFQSVFEGYEETTVQENPDDDRVADEEVDTGVENDNDKNSGFTYG